MASANREAAKQFLDGLKTHLGRSIDRQVVAQWLKGRDASGGGHPIGYEGLFLDEFVLRATSEYLKTQCPQWGKGPETPEALARQALLAESRRARFKIRDPRFSEQIASDTPASPVRVLFGKQLGATIEETLKLWWPSQKGREGGKTAKSPVAQSCPDFAFRDPCPHRVVFEAKLFRGRTLEAAKKALADGIYQCFFYRGLPEIVEPKGRGYGYEYACLFAYDASGDQHLKRAWVEVHRDVERTCWETANIYVMILPAQRD
jgi:hypothetical protein